MIKWVILNVGVTLAFSLLTILVAFIYASVEKEWIRRTGQFLIGASVVSFCMIFILLTAEIIRYGLSL